MDLAKNKGSTSSDLCKDAPRLDEPNKAFNDARWMTGHHRPRQPSHAQQTPVSRTVSLVTNKAEGTSSPVAKGLDYLKEMRLPHLPEITLHQYCPISYEVVVGTMITHQLMGMS
ncbi:hypothetical protein EVAR_88545_1 [Eumeta japonica]|uniref:Uncharacterized protein n=1 Tax=Eumeta variegata TaxID=151549 RepID=A0A4C1WLY2_EUMVA|nr:hypothetical protein EVAR_88545_1 [Eumeta japonica]